MTLRDVQKLMNAEPFEPFEFVAVDGSVWPVPSRDYVYLPPGNRHGVLVADGKGGTMPLGLRFIVEARSLSVGSKRRRAG
jgi:hypothetical protein